MRAEGSANSHGGMNYEGQAVLSGPLAPGKLAFRGSGFYRHDGGYIDLRDEDTGEIIRHNTNTIDSFGGRLALSGSLGERADATLSVLYQSEDHDAVNSSFSGRGVSNTVPLPPRSRVARGDNFRKDRTFLPNLTVNGDLGFAKLTSSSSYINRSLKIGADGLFGVGFATFFDDSFLAA